MIEKEFNKSISKKIISRYTPRWIVLVVDVVLAVFSLIFINIFIAALSRNFSATFALFPIQAVIVTAFTFITSKFCGTYLRVVRIASSQLASAIALHCFALTFSLFTFNIFIRIIAGIWLFTNSFLIVFFPILFASMVTVRLIAKQIFLYCDQNKTANNTNIKVAVFGSDPDALKLTNSLVDGTNPGYSPCAIVATRVHEQKMNFMNLPFIECDNLLIDKLKSLNCFHLLIPNHNFSYLSTELLNKLIDNDIQILKMSTMEKYDPRTKSLYSQVENIQIADLLDREVISTNNSELASQIANKAIMVTGAAGSIGSEICRQIASFHPSCLIMVDQAETPMHLLLLELQSKYPNLCVEPIIADVTNAHRMESIFAKNKPRHIYHAAAYKHVPMMERQPCEAVYTNIHGTRVIADMAVRFASETMVMVSTDKAVNPTNVMGASKRIAEMYIQSCSSYNNATNCNTTRFITTRFGNVLGSNGSVVPHFAEQIRVGGPVTITHREIIRYFMTISEATSLVLEAGCMGKGGEIFVFDMGKPIKILDLAKKMIKLCGLRPEIDIDIVETGLRPGEKLYEELLNDKELTIPTHHKKILIAKVQPLDHDEIIEKIDKLIITCLCGDANETVRDMKKIVPEYVSQNSSFANI